MLDGGHKGNHCVTIRCSVELLNDRRPELSLAVPTRLASISQIFTSAREGQSDQHARDHRAEVSDSLVLISTNARAGALQPRKGTVPIPRSRSACCWIRRRSCWRKRQGRTARPSLCSAPHQLPITFPFPLPAFLIRITASHLSLFTPHTSRLSHHPLKW